VNDQYVLFLFLATSAILSVFAVTLTVLLLIHRHRQTKSKLEKQELQFRHEKELLESRIEVQEQSMSLISEELHDHIGQMLGLVKMHINILKKSLSAEAATTNINQADELLIKTIKGIRHISHSLNTGLIQQIGLVDQLEKDFDYIQDAADLRCSLQITGKPYSLKAEQNLLIYRIIQESIQNVIKHANASHLLLSMDYEPTRLTIRVKDDGEGFLMSEKQQSQTLGLRNIASRCRLLKAQYEVNSLPEKGTESVIIIPQEVNHEQG
jgi:signal transduction histidine kinase